MQKFAKEGVFARKLFLQVAAPRLQVFRLYNEGTIVAAKEPFLVDLEANKRYSWCSCGKSKKQPYCDGSHKGTSLSPFRFKLEEKDLKVLCGCKQTSTAPYCDGTHMSDVVQATEIGQPCKV